MQENKPVARNSIGNSQILAMGSKPMKPLSLSISLGIRKIFSNFSC